MKKALPQIELHCLVLSLCAMSLSCSGASNFVDHSNKNILVAGTPAPGSAANNFGSAEYPVNVAGQNLLGACDVYDEIQNDGWTNLSCSLRNTKGEIILDQIELKSVEVAYRDGAASPVDFRESFDAVNRNTVRFPVMLSSLVNMVKISFFPKNKAADKAADKMAERVLFADYLVTDPLRDKAKSLDVGKVAAVTAPIPSIDYAATFKAGALTLLSGSSVQCPANTSIALSSRDNGVLSNAISTAFQSATRQGEAACFSLIPGVLAGTAAQSRSGSCLGDEVITGVSSFSGDYTLLCSTLSSSFKLGARVPSVVLLGPASDASVLDQVALPFRQVGVVSYNRTTQKPLAGSVIEKVANALPADTTAPWVWVCPEGTLWVGTEQKSVMLMTQAVPVCAPIESR